MIPVNRKLGRYDVIRKLARGGTPANRVAPQAARSLNDYFHPDR